MKKTSLNKTNLNKTNLNKTSTRRKFLKEMGALSGGTILANSPLGLFISSVLGSAFTREMALAAGINPRRYVSLRQPAAPPRWMYDLMLNAYGSTNQLNLGNASLGTRYVNVGNRYENLVYETVLLNGIRVPHMWANNVPAPVGTRPMKDLLNNLLVLQGINTTNPGHAGSIALHYKPSGATRSLGALSADYSTAFIPAVNIGASGFIFRSLEGKSAVTIGSGGNLLQKLLNPFLSQASADFKQKRKVALAGPLKAAETAMAAEATADHPMADTLVKSQLSAEQLLNDGFSDLATVWTDLFNKYKDLVHRSITSVLPGINDMPIGSANPATRGLDYQSDKQIVKFPDVRTLVSSPTLDIANLAEQFAMTEYVLTKNLSYSLNISPGSLVNMKVVAGMNSVANHVKDEHFVGKVPSLLINSLVYTALSACLLELISSLKTAGIWTETVVDLGGEFNRSARVDGSGSDHGYLGASVALYSGGFNGPLVLGNVMAAPGANAWGRGAPVAGLGRQLQLNDVASTIAYLLRTPSPVTSANSLVSVNSTTHAIAGSVEKSKRV